MTAKWTIWKVDNPGTGSICPVLN
eukprot:SAG11_NODE_1841_length_4182_cov_4.130541_1_plen_23_part_10